MKIKNLITVIFLGITSFMTSCDDMNALHKTYLEQGERIYAAKIDSVSPGPGNERINMEVFINSQRINKLRIYWNARMDSVDYEINQQKGIFNIMIENLPEREYLFQILSFDKYGNSSLPVEASSRTYGANYQKTLPKRNLNGITKGPNGQVTLRWAVAAEDAEFTVLTYIDNVQKEHTVKIPASESTFTVEDYLPSSEFIYYTVYRPAKNSPDTFNTEEVSNTFPK